MPGSKDHANHSREWLLARNQVLNEIHRIHNIQLHGPSSSENTPYALSLESQPYKYIIVRNVWIAGLTYKDTGLPYPRWVIKLSRKTKLGRSITALWSGYARLRMNISRYWRKITSIFTTRSSTTTGTDNTSNQSS